MNNYSNLLACIFYIQLWFLFRTVTAPPSADTPKTETTSIEDDPTGGHTLRERTRSLTEQMVSTYHTVAPLSLQYTIVYVTCLCPLSVSAAT